MEIIQKQKSLLNALSNGGVPNFGIEELVQGRDNHSRIIMNDINVVQNNQSKMRFWIGDFGSGKSLMSKLISTLAIKKGFIVSTFDLAPERRLYSNDEKSVNFYKEFIRNLFIDSIEDKVNLETILENWYKIFSEDYILNEIQLEKKFRSDIKVHINNSNFSTLIHKFILSKVTDNFELFDNIIKFFNAEYSSKIDTKKDLGVTDKIDYTNWFSYFYELINFFKIIGYKGTVINVDEAINIYKISNIEARNKNYEKILNFYNDCINNNIKNCYFNIFGTLRFLKDEKKGLYSYQAFKSRLDIERLNEKNFVSDLSPVAILSQLEKDHVIALMHFLNDLYQNVYELDRKLLNLDDIILIYKKIMSKLSADEFITTRDYVKVTLSILAEMHEKNLTFEKVLNYTSISNSEIELNIENNPIEII